MSVLVELNNFRKNTEGVYSADEIHGFDYSDGEASEVALHKVLSSVQNLSSDSTELEGCIVDWPSEYHLSSARANLLRCLDLSGVEKVLELGCGCGSISRYLGEQSHLKVDSIEGSANRAALAALRCRDLDNVSITCANFNDIQLPEDYYDLVLFVGVTEYAGRFSKKLSDQEALQDLLGLAKRTLTPDGVALIAIENRTGLKYLCGATEDHFGKPFVGIENYPEKEGICTYTKKEWQAQISASSFTESEFLYPFPDYKVPSLVVHDRALRSDPSSSELNDVLARVKSRDYLQAFDLGENEAMLWRGMYQAGSLDLVANSFLILLSNAQKGIEEISDFSVKEFSNPQFCANYEPKYHGGKVVNDFQGASLNIQLQDELKILKDQLDQMKRSRGWRWLERLRALRIPGLRSRK